MGAFYGAALLLGVHAEDLLRVPFAWFHLQQNINITKKQDFLYSTMQALFPDDAHQTVENRLFVTLNSSGLFPKKRVVSTYFSFEDLMDTIVAAVTGYWTRPVEWRGRKVFGDHYSTPLF